MHNILILCNIYRCICIVGTRKEATNLRRGGEGRLSQIMNNLRIERLNGREFAPTIAHIRDFLENFVKREMVVVKYTS